MVPLMNEPLTVFIASAIEGREVAKSVKAKLQAHSELLPYLWDEEGVFEPSLAFIESLERQLAKTDFAVLTLTPDDKVIARGKKSKAPRDNILFELGLFMGRIGRERTFFLYDNQHDIKLPSDITGLAGVHYERTGKESDPQSLTCTCLRLVTAMIQRGPRFKTSLEQEYEGRRSREFCRQITGSWWARQRLRGSSANRLAFFTIKPNDLANTVRISGVTYDERGVLFARWTNPAIGLRVQDSTVLFAWEGTHPAEPDKAFGGFGQYKFDQIEDGSRLCVRGSALFSDIEQGGEKAPHWTSVDLRRADDDDRVNSVMTAGNDEERAAEIIRVLAQFSR